MLQAFSLCIAYALRIAMNLVTTTTIPSKVPTYTGAMNLVALLNCVPSHFAVSTEKRPSRSLVPIGEKSWMAITRMSISTISNLIVIVVILLAIVISSISSILSTIVTHNFA